MKNKIIISIFTLFIVALLVSCSGIPKMNIPSIKKSTLAKILVYVGEVPLGESGRSADGKEINKGASIVFTAQGRDTEGNPIIVNPTWTPSKPGIVEITPMTGSKVFVKGLKEGTVDILVEYDGVKKTIELISVR